jgi:ribonuclease P protein component
MASGLEHLKTRADFLRVAGRRVRVARPGFVLQSAPAPEGEGVRVGFTASRKVGNAVARNRARRRLRAAAALLMPHHAADGRDYVLIARAATIMRPWDELLGDLETALKRVRAWRDGAEDAA